MDSIKFSGKIVASLSLLSSRILRLTPDYTQSDWNESDILRENLPAIVEVVLKPRTFYVLSGDFRYRYNHEILGMSSNEAILVPVEMRPQSLERRISVMFRDALEPLKANF